MTEPSSPARPAAWRAALVLAATGVLLISLLAVTLKNVWYCMALANVVLSVQALWTVPLQWRALWRPRAIHLALGVGSAAGLYVAGAVVFVVLQHVSGGAEQTATMYDWRAGVPRAWIVPVLFAMVLGEEIVWRNAVTLPLADQLGRVRGPALAALLFALAHVAIGVPALLVAAFGAGLVWSALVAVTRSAVPAFVSHLLWNVAVLLIWPYHV